MDKAERKGGRRRPTKAKQSRSLKWFARHKKYFGQKGLDWPPCLQPSDWHANYSEREIEVIKFQKLILERHMRLQPETSTLTMSFDSSQSVDRCPQTWHGVLPCWCPFSKVHLHHVSRAFDADDTLVFEHRRILPAEALQLAGAVFLFNIMFFQTLVVMILLLSSAPCLPQSFRLPPKRERLLLLLLRPPHLPFLLQIPGFLFQIPDKQTNKY